VCVVLGGSLVDIHVRTAMTTTSATNRAADYDEIVRIVHLYTDAFGAGDVTAFEEAFHADAWIFFTHPDGSLFKSPIRECFEGWATPQARIDGRIISVTQAGDIANVLLGFDNVDEPTNSWVDLHNLIRVDGIWKITNKTATHTSRAGGN
jgi:hypothetical protein